ncbi:hypothetical protein ACFFGH_24460 [Lysobacter korlensis]|uniref:Uncharacterized protein n=1 Tax=Lysobacter korlensis TaxID=553636 RepID=A0ABV6RVJ3_9GAMM
MNNVDIPAIDELLKLSEERGPASVSIYIPTNPVTQQSQSSKIELRNALAEVERKCRERGLTAQEITAVAAPLRALVDDEEFWRYQSKGLAVFATGSTLRTFRLGVDVVPEVVVNDRFRVGQLLQAVTFPQQAYVLALSEKTARLIELGAGSPRTLDVDGLPPDRSVLAHTEVADKAAMPRPQGTTGGRIEQQKYCRLAQDAVLPIVSKNGSPLVLAAPEPIGPAYQAISTYAHFAHEVIEGNFDEASNDQIAAKAEPILGHMRNAELERWRNDFAEFENQGRATTDLAETARAATYGAIESLMIDPCAQVFGRLADEDGSVQFGEPETSGNYSLIDEIAARVLHSSGRVLAVPSSDVPNGSPVAAILRYGI